MDEADQSEHHKTTGNEYYRLNAQLIEHLNGNIHYQLFCGVQIDPLHPLTNPKGVTSLRQELKREIPMDEVKQRLENEFRKLFRIPVAKFGA